MFKALVVAAAMLVAIESRAAHGEQCRGRKPRSYSDDARFGRSYKFIRAKCDTEDTDEDELASVVCRPVTGRRNPNHPTLPVIDQIGVHWCAKPAKSVELFENTESEIESRCHFHDECVQNEFYQALREGTCQRAQCSNDDLCMCVR